MTGSWDSLNQRSLFGFAAPASAGVSPVTSYDIFVDGVYRYVVS